MSGLRNYSAGELSGNASITREHQLACPANFEGADGQLFLVRCVACGDPQRGRENHMMAAASGSCAWCGWSAEGAPAK